MHIYIIYTAEFLTGVIKQNRKTYSYYHYSVLLTQYRARGPGNSYTTRGLFC